VKQAVEPTIGIFIAVRLPTEPIAARLTAISLTQLAKRGVI
jgi:hypothetical protein